MSLILTKALELNYLATGLGWVAIPHYLKKNNFDFSKSVFYFFISLNSNVLAVCLHVQPHTNVFVSALDKS